MSAIAADVEMRLRADSDAEPAPRGGAPGSGPRLAQRLQALGVLLALLIGLWLVLGLRQDAAVSELEIEAPLQRIPAGEIRATLAPLLQGGLLDIELAAARDALEALPWVARARVERVWPATLRVRVWERTAFARWGASQLVDTEARTFTPRAAEIDAALPQLAGARGHEREVIDTWHRLQERLLGTPFALGGLSRDARGEWLGRTVDGLELRFGQGAPELRLDVLLGPVARALKDNLQAAAHVDLRYTNGFAVGWRAQDPAGEGEKHG